MKVTGDATQEDIDAILGAQRVAVDAVQSGDLESYMGHLSDDAIVMPPGIPAIHGRQAIRYWISGAFQQFEIKVQVSTVELIISGDWAIDRHRFVQMITPRGGGEQIHIEGKAIAIYRKIGNGEWKAYVDCWNNDSS